jgi:hypothetical protein
VTGDGPNQTLEAQLVELFERHPHDVSAAVEHVAGRYERGEIHAPWVILLKHAQETVEVRERANSATATDERGRDKAMLRARQWMRNVGIHYDLAREVEDELRHGFTSGMTGGLKITNDEDIVELLGLWRQLRPLGEQVEREAEERGRRYVAQRKAMIEHAAKTAPPPPEPEPERQLVSTTGNPFM